MYLFSEGTRRRAQVKRPLAMRQVPQAHPAFDQQIHKSIRLQDNIQDKHLSHLQQANAIHLTWQLQQQQQQQQRQPLQAILTAKQEQPAIPDRPRNRDTNHPWS